MQKKSKNNLNGEKNEIIIIIIIIFDVLKYWICETYLFFNFKIKNTELLRKKEGKFWRVN